VEKTEGGLKGHKNVTVIDLPGVYSLSPNTLEEVIARNYLIDERPDVILNVVDGSNLERNLLLTLQLTEMGVPVVVAINMMDVVSKTGGVIDSARLAKELGCQVMEVSALKGAGVKEAAEAAVRAAIANSAADVSSSGPRRKDLLVDTSCPCGACGRASSACEQASRAGFSIGRPALPESNCADEAMLPLHSFSDGVEHTLAHIKESFLQNLPQKQQRFAAIKLFERDAKIIEKLTLSPEQTVRLEVEVKQREAELKDDSGSIITAERYARIDSIIKKCLVLKNRGRLSASDKIDSVVTNRWLALPCFAAVMFIVYFTSITTIGGIATDWMNEGVFGDGWRLFGIESLLMPGIPALLGNFLEFINCAEWLQGFILDGAVAGVGAVLGFVPQMLILFMFLAFLEMCGYMARIAFIMDRIFRHLGLSGKSFIPIMIGTGCGVPAIMASRAIGSDSERKMTIMTTTFIPCAAKLPIIALITGALFDGAAWVAASAYFIGMAAIICSGLILKKTSLFAGSAAPFVMELPTYHWPAMGSILRRMWERGWSFIKKAGTIILLAAVFVWFASRFGWGETGFGMVDMTDSILSRAGRFIAPLFSPLGWGDWQAAVAAFTGLVAKENVVGTFGVLFGFGEAAEDGLEVWNKLAASFTTLSAFSFLIFNLLCAPCFAAIGAIRREMNSTGWFWIAIGYQCVFAYIVSMCIYQLGMLFSAGSFGMGTLAALLFVALFLFLLLRPVKKKIYDAEAMSIGI
jgi:ferrous iron transport protein B